ncbi:MAG TPA: DUF362 domain-containing protein [Ruminiclostridium sp.]
MIPKLIKIKQNFHGQYIEDIESKISSEIKGSGVKFAKDSNIAIAVGSRGIANIHRIVKATVENLQALGAKPFIVPAMGSHGGATAEGQKEVLEGYGITEEYIGAPIKSSMQVVEIPQDHLCHKVYMDRFASEADGIIVINRIKVHTDFHGKTESGLLKMCVIGLGKHKQALEMHRYGIFGLRELIPIAAKHVLQHSKILLGIGIVENAYDQTAVIKAIRPEVMEEEEVKLLDICRRNMPKLPVDKLDLLIVDEMGKDITGVGIDPNITGRIRIRNEKEPETPDITNIVVTDLTEASHGNALGMGLADFITKRLYDKINFKATYENVLTSTFLERGKMPIVADTDKRAVEYALRTCGPIILESSRVIRIKNTLHLGEIYVSQCVYEEIKDLDYIEVIGEFEEMFNEQGQLKDFKLEMH